MHGILVTGGNGQLGKTLEEEVKKFSLNNTDYKWFFKGHDEVDICDYEELECFVIENNIDIIINCAALTNVDKAEQDRELAFKINEMGVRNIADISREFGVFVIHISTDYVFNGQYPKLYNEDDGLSPINIYGLTKMYGERELEEKASEYVIIRTSLLYSEHGENFVTKMISAINSWDGNMERKVVVDQITSPTYARDLCYMILRMLEYTHRGVKEIYHFANKGLCSRYDLAKMIERIYKEGLKGKSMFVPCMSNEFNVPAKRPPFTSFDTRKIEDELDFKIPFWVDSLERCITNIKKIKGDH